MAITDDHVKDLVTGFALDPVTGHAIGLVPPPIQRVNHDDEWPKWIEPHASHIVRKEADGAPPSISVLGGFSDVHIDRLDGKVSVLVLNEDEEKEALAELKSQDEPRAEIAADDMINEDLAPAHLKAEEPFPTVDHPHDAGDDIIE